jgi:hypothetical protein
MTAVGHHVSVPLAAAVLTITMAAVPPVVSSTYAQAVLTRSYRRFGHHQRDRHGGDSGNGGKWATELAA